MLTLRAHHFLDPSRGPKILMAKVVCANAAPKGVLGAVQLGAILGHFFSQHDI